MRRRSCSRAIILRTMVFGPMMVVASATFAQTIDPKLPAMPSMEGPPSTGELAKPANAPNVSQSKTLAPKPVTSGQLASKPSSIQLPANKTPANKIGEPAKASKASNTGKSDVSHKEAVGKRAATNSLAAPKSSAKNSAVKSSAFKNSAVKKLPRR